MNKLFALLALALVIALPACRKDNDLKNRVKTTRYDDTGKKVYEKKEKGVAKKGNMRRNMDTLVDEEDLADGEQKHRRNHNARKNENREYRGEHKGHKHHGNKNRATMVDCDDLDCEDESCDYDDQD